MAAKDHVCSGCGTPHPAASCVDDGHEHDYVAAGQLPADEVGLLRYLAVLGEDRKAIDRDEREAVEALRLLGVSWPKIALRLDVSRATLQRQYAYLGGS